MNPSAASQRLDADALQALLERHGPTVRRAIEADFPQRWQALITPDDVMQESYTDAFLALKSLSPSDAEHFERWLMSIARRNLIDAIRCLEANKRGGDARPVPLDGSSYDALFDALGAESGTTPSAAAAREEAIAALKVAIARLPDDYRTVIDLCDISQTPPVQVAARLERSLGAVFMLRSRAHRALRDALGSGSRFFSIHA